MHRTRWYMVSMRYGKNISQAEDILQEGLIRIYTSLHQYNVEKSAFSTWSTRLIVNAALRYLKKHSWQNTFVEVYEASDIADHHETIYDKLAAKELTKLVQKLPMGYRIVFNMYCIEGYSHKEIAKNLNIAEGTSKSQLSKARRGIKKLIELQLIKSSNGKYR